MSLPDYRMHDVALRLRVATSAANVHVHFNSGMNKYEIRFFSPNGNENQDISREKIVKALRKGFQAVGKEEPKVSSDSNDGDNHTIYVGIKTMELLNNPDLLRDFVRAANLPSYKTGRSIGVDDWDPPFDHHVGGSGESM